MMKLRRVYETAEEEGRAVEDVALERFGSLELFDEAREERRILDEREGKRASRDRDRDRDRDRGRDRKGKGREPEGAGERRLMFTDLSTPSGGTSRSSSFRRPDLDRSGPPTPTVRSDGTRRQEASKLGQTAGAVRTPIPSAMTPTGAGAGVRARGMSPSSLNKLQAKVLRAKLMGAPNADTLEKEFEEAQRRANGGDAEEGNVKTQVAVLPTLDIHGRMYDVGQGGQDTPPPAGNRRPKPKVSSMCAWYVFAQQTFGQVEQRDPKTGEMTRVDPDADDITLGEMLRQEKFGAGMADQKNLDAEFARAVMTDGGFQVRPLSLPYLKYTEHVICVRD